MEIPVAAEHRDLLPEQVLEQRVCSIEAFAGLLAWVASREEMQTALVVHEEEGSLPKVLILPDKVDKAVVVDVANRRFDTIGTQAVFDLLNHAHTWSFFVHPSSCLQRNRRLAGVAGFRIDFCGAAFDPVNYRAYPGIGDLISTSDFSKHVLDWPFEAFRQTYAKPAAE